LVGHHIGFRKGTCCLAFIKTIKGIFRDFILKLTKKNLREDAHLLGSIRRARNGVLANRLKEKTLPWGEIKVQFLFCRFGLGYPA